MNTVTRLALPLTFAVLSGCTALPTAAPAPQHHSHPSLTHHAAPHPVAHRSPTPAAAAAPVLRSGRGPVVVAGLGWNSNGLSGPMPAPGTCHIRYAANGEPLPDPRCTPGAVTDAVTQANLSSTICRRGGYTSSVRPPEDLTEPAKRQLMAAYGIPWSQASRTELDHLDAIEVGGSPGSLLNLWPEPDDDRRLAHRNQYVRNDKDGLSEAPARNALCGGKVALATIQRAFASNWTTVAGLL